MRRLGSSDKALLALLLPIWAVCFGLCLRSFQRGVPVPPVGVRADGAGGYPILIDMAPWAHSERTVLQPGDRLVELGTTDLRGVGPLGFYARFLAEAESGKPLPRVIYERGGRRGETTPPTPVWLWPHLPVSLGFVFTALFLALRAPPSRVARSLSRACLLSAIATALPFTGSIPFDYASLALGAVFWSLAFPLCLGALALFVREEPPVSASARIAPWLFASMGLLTVSTLTGFPVRRPISVPLTLLVLLAYFASLLVLVARAYRRAGAVRRRQIRWLLFGFYGAVVPPAAVTALVVIDGLLVGEWRRFQPLLWPSFSFGVLIPLSVLFAIVRYNFFDVDRLLSATASYNVVLVALVGAGLVLVPRFGELSSELLGVDPRVGQVALSLALAGIVVPAHQRLRPWIDQVFFKERYALDHGMAELVRALSACVDTRALTQQAGAALHRLLRPETCVVYARAGEAFAPVFVEGRAVPPAFEAASPLVATLHARHRPLALSASGRRPDPATLGPFDRAALEALEAQVVVPVRRDEALVAFLCLGPKRSGDVYTSTDLSHLASVAEAVSSQLRRFEQEQTLREAREMQASLRRYVPGAVAEQLASGAELAAGEREVTVLFVDLRGYTSYAESRRAEEIFSTVNRYTEAVSEIVRRHGGSVVEFNGDGMMAVFGAPREIARKERAAVEAGREILSAVEGLPGEAAEAGGARLSVGVGIASGAAFVGNIRAADRLIWSAIGNTTNLAARLQGLTRELEAALVIDTATWQALGPDARDFERHGSVAIRGRSQAEDVYALPLGGRAPAM